LGVPATSTMTKIPRSLSSSVGRTHLASGAFLGSFCAVEAEEEANAVFRCVRVVCATVGETKAKGDNKYTRPELSMHGC
jgi:hypothetical protein